MKRLRIFKLAAALALLAGWRGSAAAQHLRYNANAGTIESPTGGINFYAPIITAASAIVAPDFYINSYYRNSVGYSGLYNSPSGTHFYAIANSQWVLGGANTYPQLLFRNGHNGTILGRVYADANGFGFLHAGHDWMVRTPHGSDVAVFPGSIQIGTNGGITPSPSSYGSMALSGIRNTYYGVQFGAAMGQPMLMCNNADSACGIYHYNNGAWRDYWAGNTSIHRANGHVNATSGVQKYEGGVYKTALTKVVTATFCSNNTGCNNAPCPAGSYTAVVSCTGLQCYVACCWGQD